MSFLNDYFLSNGHKRLHKWLHYFDIYEKHFERFRGKQPTILEIGIFGGGSLAMWKEYFGEGCRIAGLDINEECKQHEAPGIEIFIGSQDDEKILSQIVDKYGAFDVIIDDGSHVMSHMRKTFEFLYPRMSPTGVYLVEDTHTCYWPAYGGGHKKPDSFMEFTKDKLDELNAVHSKGAVAVSDFTKSTQSISVYDSINVFERRPQGKRQHLTTGPMIESPSE